MSVIWCLEMLTTASRLEDQYAHVSIQELDIGPGGAKWGTLVYIGGSSGVRGILSP
jgi:hypothetical protein